MAQARQDVTDCVQEVMLRNSSSLASSLSFNTTTTTTIYSETSNSTQSSQHQPHNDFLFHMSPGNEMRVQLYGDCDSCHVKWSVPKGDHLDKLHSMGMLFNLLGVGMVWVSQS